MSNSESGIAIALACALVIALPTLAQDITSPDGMWTATLDPFGGANTGQITDLIGPWGTTDNLFETLWYEATSTGGDLTSRVETTYTNTAANVGSNTAQFTLLRADGVLELQVDVTMLNGTSGGALFNLTWTNVSGGPVSIKPFAYCDFDVGPSTLNDAVWLPGTEAVEQANPTAGKTVWFGAIGPYKSWEIDTFANLRSALDSGIVQLGNTGGSPPTADYTAALSVGSVTLSPGQSHGMSLGLGGVGFSPGTCPGTGDCCVANGTPGCDDFACCIAICAIDPLCCDNAWDGVCADEAAADPVNCSQCVAPTGACCIVTDCVILSESECQAQGGVYQGDGTTCEGGQSTTYESFPNAPLPDADPVGVSDTITVPDSFTITDLNVGLQLTHTFVGDLCVTLVHQPTGTTVNLIQRMGTTGGCHLGGPFGCLENNMNIVLDDQGNGGPIESQCTADLSSPPNYVPNNPLAAFNGLNSAGDWTLTISDNAGADLGTFVSWALIIGAAGGGPCETSCPWDLNGDGSVGILDLLALLAAWGPNPGHPADFNGDGSVGILDLLALLANWGPCP